MSFDRSPGPAEGGESTLDRLVRAAADDPSQIAMLCHALVRSELIVFGAVQDRGEATGVAQLDILHYLDGGEQVMPVFTDERHAAIAAEHDPTITELEAITVRGLDLLERAGDGVVILVNAWSDVETEVTPAQLRGAAGAMRRARPQ